MADLLYWKWLQSPELHESELILPVPLHRRRERTRGFNQSRILAKSLSCKIERPCEGHVLVRTRNTASQTGLSHRQRRLNVAHAFVVRNSDRILGKNCLLVDDVFTTGATLNEVAKVLKQAGARKVLALTVARVSSRVAIDFQSRGATRDL
jgi:ComF family protein